MEPRGKLIRPKKSNVQLMFNTHDPLEEIHRAERAQEDDYFRQARSRTDCGAPRKERRRNRAGHSALYSYALPKVWRAFKGNTVTSGHH